MPVFHIRWCKIKFIWPRDPRDTAPSHGSHLKNDVVDGGEDPRKTCWWNIAPEGAGTTRVNTQKASVSVKVRSISSGTTHAGYNMLGFLSGLTLNPNLSLVYNAWIFVDNYSSPIIYFAPKLCIHTLMFSSTLA